MPILDSTPEATTLDQLDPGMTAAILEVRNHDQPLCLRLQEMGLVPGATVLVLSRHGGLVVRVNDQRLCLGEALARSVDVMAV